MIKMTAPLRVLHSYALVAMDAKDATTMGGLEIPETARRQAKWGTVVSIGPGRFVPVDATRPSTGVRRFVPTELRPGDRVYVGAFNGWCVHGRGARVSGDLSAAFDGDAEWWIVETLPGVQQENHPGDVYLYERSEA